MGFMNQTKDVTVSRPHDEDIESLSQSSERNSNSTSDFSRSKSSGDKEALIEIARRENRNVRTIRIITFTAVIICAIVVSTLVYYFATGSDTLSFELEVSKRDAALPVDTMR
jgi:hypothetical protein